MTTMLPLRAEETAKPATVEIRAHNGRPMVFLDGRPDPLPAYSPRSWNKNAFPRQASRFYPYHLGMYLIGLPNGIDRDFNGTQFWNGDRISSEPQGVTAFPDRYASIEEPVQLIIAGDPDARLLLRFDIHEPRSWRALHRDQLFVTEDGATLDTPSLASDLYWDAAARYCRALIGYCESRPWGSHLIGYANFHRDEGCHEPVINGWLFDHSPLMTARWRAYLREKYATVEMLRAAYHDPALTFETIEVPKDKLRGPTPQVSQLLYWQAARENQPLRDYLLLQRDLFLQHNRQLFAAMHDATKRRVICVYDMFKQTMQGWNCGDFFDYNASRRLADPDLMSGSGSMDVASLYDLPGFDGLITPHDYQARGVGGVFEPEGIADSVVLHGKLFFCEMDTRTYVDHYNGYGKALDDREYAAVSWRNLATALTRGFNFYWMDLTSDWFSPAPIQQVIDRQVQVVKESAAWEHETVPGIAMILDDTAALETNGAGNYLNDAVMWEQKMGLARCGVPFRVYLLDDLKLPNFPRHRVFYFPNLFKVDDARLALLKQKVFRDGNVVVWGPGSGISDGTTIGAASVEKLTGFQCELLPVNFPHRTLIANFDHPLTKGLSADSVIGSPLAYGPLVFPRDGIELGLAWTKQGKSYRGLSLITFGRGAKAVAGATPLGAGDYAAVFTTAVPLPADLWRNLARYAGAHVYSTTNDILLADRTIVALHSLQSGPKRIDLPGTYTVYDVITGKLVAGKAHAITFNLHAPETRVFRLVKEK